ncbi:hypothetical protein CBS101457_001791 [Exobasidium rhododendri]|nr:hypothetical protein CBS101457_001791 [Exobasidium rhododendri]
MSSGPASGSNVTLSSSNPISTPSRKQSDRRLFVSNLAPQLTEHDLLLLFKPYGTLKKLDLIFHRSGPQKGKPKGYAFVELAQKDEAEKARRAIEGRTIKGREVRISFASVNEEPEVGLGPHRRKKVEDTGRPTTLSLMKNLKRYDSTDARIAAMEAKLSAIQRRTAPDSITTSTAPNGQPLPPIHPSLPSRPSGS